MTQVSSDLERLPVSVLLHQVKRLREDLLEVVLAEVPWVLDHPFGQVIEEDRLLQVVPDL